MYHALRYFLSALAHCGKRGSARGSALGQAFAEFSEAYAFYCLHQAAQISKVIWKRWEIWSACSKIPCEIPQR